MLTLKTYQKNALQTLDGFLQACRSLPVAAAYHAALALQNRTREAEYSAEFGETPCVCLRIPTGGGKTLLAAHAIAQSAKTLTDSDAPIALWLTPSDTIRTQTLQALNTARHPYRAALEHYFPQRVRVCELDSLETISPHEIGQSAIVIVATIQSFRITDKTKRNVYAFYEDLAPHFEGLSPAVLERLDKVSQADIEAQPYLTQKDIGRVKSSIANWFNLHRPIAIVDEAHNNRTHNSFEALRRLNPCCIIELTATPVKGSNVLYHVSAQELKNENMVKLPIVLAEHPTGWADAVRDAILTRTRLDLLAQQEREYIRPIVLFQAQPKGNEAVVDVLRTHLIEQEKIPADQIAVVTGDQKELDGINLFDPLCKIRYVITVEALKEGWDCSFAYVLCSLQEVNSSKDVEQLLGRVLRMPYARSRNHPDLNQAYAHIVASSFAEAANRLTDSMVANMGFEALEVATIFQPALPLEGGEGNQTPAPLLPDFVLTMQQAPQLAALSVEERSQVEIRQTTQGVTVIVRGELTEGIEKALVESVPAKQREVIQQKVATHHAMHQALQAPGVRGATFAAIPQLCLQLEGEWQVVERETLADLGNWSLLNQLVQLAGFSIQETVNAFMIDIEQHKVVLHPLEQQQFALNGIETQASETDLVRWLDRETRQPDITQAEMQQYLGLQVRHLQRDKGYTLTALVRAKYQLAVALRAEIERLRIVAQKNGFQKMLFDMRASPLTGQYNVRFQFRPGFYPARPPYYNGRFRFKKHYFEQIHDLHERNQDRSYSEEFLCAQAIETNQQVKYWVRNIERQDKTSFWLPTSSDYFYPDFMCELLDGRILAVEYKGAHLVDNDDTREKLRIGEQWEKTSNGKCLFLLAVKVDTKGRELAKQLEDKILSSN
jgi:type III restriction enzyme